MRTQKLSPWVTGLVALILVVVVVAISWRLLRGNGSLLRDVVVQADVITPNADGETDATRIQYELSRNATVSIYFEDEANGRFYFLLLETFKPVRVNPYLDASYIPPVNE